MSFENYCRWSLILCGIFAIFGPVYASELPLKSSSFRLQRGDFWQTHDYRLTNPSGNIIMEAHGSDIQAIGTSSSFTLLSSQGRIYKEEEISGGPSRGTGGQNHERYHPLSSYHPDGEHEHPHVIIVDPDEKIIKHFPEEIPPTAKETPKEEKKDREAAKIVDAIEEVEILERKEDFFKNPLPIKTETIVSILKKENIEEYQHSSAPLPCIDFDHDPDITKRLYCAPYTQYPYFIPAIKHAGAPWLLCCLLLSVAMYFIPVSYTHLTLPTIYSV